MGVDKLIELLTLVDVHPPAVVSKCAALEYKAVRVVDEHTARRKERERGRMLDTWVILSRRAAL